MNWYKKATAETTSIYELLEEGTEDIPANEVLYDFISVGELHVQLPIKIIDEPKMLMTHKGDMTVWESYQFADDQSQELIDYYAKHKPVNDVIVVNENRVLDGNHRVIASIIGKWPLRAIDIADIGESEEDEEE
jgi:hypothetical protein